MAPDLRHTLTNLEITPPAGAWNTIVSRLDTEFDAAEIKVSEKLSDFEMAPPAAAWDNIEGAIVNDPEEVENAPVIYINRRFRTRAAAAAAIIVLAIGGWYFLNNQGVPENSVTQVPLPGVNEATVIPVPKKSEAASAPVIDREIRPLPRRAGTVLADAKNMQVSQASYTYAPTQSYHPAITSSDYLPHAGLAVQSVSTASVPNVEAPPIRDANGNIILDKELIFATDNNYIVVTGPNGEQTRISSKFLPLLSSLNGSLESLDYIPYFLNENSIWKLRFNEWRDKMLRQATFIPTATNLLDILELKDILQEN